MPDWLESLNGILERLLQVAAEDATLRMQLRQFAQAVIDRTEQPAVPPEHVAIADVSGEALLSVEVAGAQEVSRTEPLPELTLGQAHAAPEPITWSPRWPEPTDADLSLIESRCRLKAEGARWAARRRRLLADEATYATDIEPLDRDIIARAKALPDCFLWMCHPSGPAPADVAGYEVVARGFENVAEVLAILRLILEEGALRQGLVEQGLDLLAEAQSALRVAISALDGPSDADQLQIFAWLKGAASQHQVFIPRYMRANDMADPAQWPELAARIEAFDEAVQAARSQSKLRRRLLGKVRHKVSLICSAPEGSEESWRILVATVDELVRDGLPPSNRDLREALAPAIDLLPELAELPNNFRLVVREVDRHIATSSSSETTHRTPPSPQVERVRRLIEGRSLVVIGGQRRPGSYQALKEAFGLGDLFWIETREHESISVFEPYVARDEVVAVLLAIRWSSHSYGDVRAFCDRYGKPLVRLPGGYNPNQVAAQILEQCSERLGQHS